MNAPAEITLDRLACAYAVAKAEEAALVARRRAIGDQIAQLLKDRDEGSRTEHTETNKVTVTYKMDRKVDSAGLQALWPQLSEGAQAAFRWSADVSLARLRALQELRPEEYALVAACITAKEGTPQVKVEPILSGEGR